MQTKEWNDLRGLTGTSLKARPISPPALFPPERMRAGSRPTFASLQPTYGFAVISEGRSTAPVSLRSLSCEEDPTRTLYLPGNASHLPVDALK
jgi:hypothetical protein